MDFQLFEHKDDKYRSILYINKTHIYYAHYVWRKHKKIMDSLLEGSSPESVLPNNFTRTPKSKVLSVTHKDDENTIYINYRNKDDTKDLAIGFERPNRKEAAMLALYVASECNLNTPEVRKASIGEISMGPSITFILTSIVVLFNYFVFRGLSVTELREQIPDLSSSTKGIATFVAMVGGAKNLLLFIPALFLICLGFWFYRYKVRPSVFTFHKSK